MVNAHLSVKPLTKETGGLETIVETSQTTVEVQGEAESLGTSVDGKTKYKRNAERSGANYYFSLLFSFDAI